MLRSFILSSFASSSSSSILLLSLTGSLWLSLLLYIRAPRDTLTHITPQLASLILEEWRNLLHDLHCLTRTNPETSSMSASVIAQWPISLDRMYPTAGKTTKEAYHHGRGQLALRPAMFTSRKVLQLPWQTALRSPGRGALTMTWKRVHIHEGTFEIIYMQLVPGHQSRYTEQRRAYGSVAS